MGQVLHASATTTEAVRRAIQHGQASLRELARRYGVNPKTVAKWRRRTSVADGTVGNSVCVWSVGRHGQARALVKRWPKSTANWALAMAHSRRGILHSRSVRFKTR